MAIIQRLSKLIQADVHGIIDTLEDPELSLKQSVREMEAELFATQSEMKSLKEKEEKMRTVIHDLEEQVEELEDKINLSLSKKQDSLAKKFIRKRLESERQLKGIQKRVESNSNRIEKLKSILSDRESRLQQILQKMEIYVEEERIKDKISKETPIQESSNRVTDEEVEVEFLKKREDHDRSASEAI